jgi:catechol-2,3-dioxygenase
VKILELKLPTAKIDEQRSFYVDELGFKVIYESDHSFTVSTGDSKLTFTNDINTLENHYHFAFNIPENQLNEAAEWLRQFSALIEYEGSHIINFPNWNAHSVYFYDPAGNIVELIARHNLNNSSKEKFSAASIINISEAGLPVSSVKDFYSTMKENFGLDLWWGNLETFAAIGDEEGLFIAVTTERNWFPTDKPCNIYSLAVKIKDPHHKTYTFEGYNYHITAL